MARHPGIVVRALSWNLFHGRDFPPDPGLFSWRSRLLRAPEPGATHVQVNRPLREEFADLIAGLDWHVALLQEVPPRWLRPLAAAAEASAASALTSRNWLAGARARLAHWNPDLMASGEGGSNQLLVRGRILCVRRITLARVPERRRMLWARVELGGGRIAVANLHASAGLPRRAAAEVLRAARLAIDWAGPDPLLFGGDLNLRPAREPAVFAELRERLGLAPPTGAEAIDHLMARGLDVLEAPARLPPARRELPGPGGLRIRLSDHAPVTAAFGLPPGGGHEGVT